MLCKVVMLVLVLRNEDIAATLLDVDSPKRQLEPTHNARFIALINQFMPHWKSRRNLLNTLPVRHEEWALIIGCALTTNLTR
ncbi:MAG: hypothetical protein ACI9R3_004334 [Verrucomicrobiales bacterium]|jgi:hypothetical protein